MYDYIQCIILERQNLVNHHLTWKQVMDDRNHLLGKLPPLETGTNFSEF